jgi:hypothetical protein
VELREVVISEPVDEAALRELWISFTSLLRSYFAMLQVIAGEPAAEVAAFDQTVFEIRSTRSLLRLRLHPASAAEGNWSLESWPGADAKKSGVFELLEDGRVEWSGLAGPAEMDQVAESVATMVAES